MNLNPDASGRDPVAIAIENLLLEMQSNGMGSIYKRTTANAVVISFGDLRAEGKTLDIALVRLASAMMDDEKYTVLLMDALNGPMRDCDAA